jgi:hypothetical protein
MNVSVEYLEKKLAELMASEAAAKSRLDKAEIAYEVRHVTRTLDDLRLEIKFGEPRGNSGTWIKDRTIADFEGAA